jgi:DNA repair protein RadD
VYQLRPYQQEAVDAAVKFLKCVVTKNGLEVLPTGSGKSLVIAGIAKELDAPTLVFQPSKEILEQNYQKMCSYGYSPGIYSASKGRKEIAQVTFATIGSVKNKVDLFKDFRYVIVDEAHGVNSKGGMYRDFFAKMNGTKVLGVTATPYRLTTDGFGGSILKFLTRTRPRIFHELIYYVQNGDLFRDGHLAPLKYYSPDGFDRSKIRLNSTGADFDDSSLRAYYRSSEFPERLLDVTRRAAKAKRNVLVFTRFIEESKYIVDRMGGQAAIVTGETPKIERERIVNDFRAGRIKVVTNAQVFTVGFDYPELETVIIARPTMSLALYYQMVGRGIRPHPDKEFCQVVDRCGNIGLFGWVEDLRIVDGKNGKWFIASGKKQLTNVYYGERKAS